jgi:hypothetical protein
VTAAVSAHAWPGRPRLGLAPPRGADVVASLVVAPVADGYATVTLERLVVRGAWTPAWYGGVVWTSSEVVEVLATRPATFTAGRASVAFPDPGDGTFRLRARRDGWAPASVRFRREGGRCGAPAPATDPARLRLAIVGAAVPSSPLALDLVAPFAGRALVTVEGPDVFVAHVLDVEAGATRIEVPLPDLRGPSLHATVTLSRGAADADDGPPRGGGASW